MYNDEIMILYLILCVYYVLRNRPILASVFFTLGLSVKAGLILLIPGFFGQMHYNFGTIKLIISFVIIMGFQVLIALPFVLGDTTVADYLHRSKLTGAGRNGIAGAAPFWDYLAAHRELTIFWGFIPHDIYFDKSAMADKLKIGMLVANVYHFFIRKRCLVPCL